MLVCNDEDSVDNAMPRQFTVDSRESVSPDPGNGDGVKDDSAVSGKSRSSSRRIGLETPGPDDGNPFDNDITMHSNNTMEEAFQSPATMIEDDTLFLISVLERRWGMLIF